MSKESKGSKGSWPAPLLDRRQMIPRWRSPVIAAHMGELGGYLATSSPRPLPQRWLAAAELPIKDQYEAVEREELAFLTRESRPLLEPPSVLLNARLTWQRVRESSEQPPTSQQVGLDSDWKQHDQIRVHSIRESLRSHPGQPLLWTELSRAYVMLGQDDKAAKAMTCALQLARPNTYVTRSAARLFMHIDDKEQALAVVRRNPNIKRDPRLLSAEVALSSVVGVSSPHAKLASTVMMDTNYRPRHVTDLAAALATIELEHGKHSQARKLFERSFRVPTENALAQAQWASAKDSHIVIPTEAWKTPDLHEAQTLAARTNGDWDGVLAAAEHWLSDERFALRPAMIGSFAIFTLEQCARSERLATAALQANADHVGLLNNRAVARAYLGRTKEAFEDILLALHHGGHEDPYLIATLGLIAYRAGDLALGKECYGTTVAHFVKEKDRSSVLLATLFWLRETALAGSKTAYEDLDYVRKQYRRVKTLKKEPEIESMIGLLEDELARSSIFPLSTPQLDVAKLHQAFAQFTPNRDVVTLRNRFIESD